MILVVAWALDTSLNILRDINETKVKFDFPVGL